MADDATIRGWINSYVKQEQSYMRGGRRKKTRAKVREDLKSAFPNLTIWQILYYVIVIMMML